MPHIPGHTGGISIEDLYDAYMDQGIYTGEAAQDFAYDIYDWFGGDKTGLSQEDWAQQYGIYIPTYDPIGESMALQDQALSQKDAGNLLDLSHKIQNRVYDTGMKDISTATGEEYDKSREISGGIGLRSGTLDSALEDTLAISVDKAGNLADRFEIKKQESLDSYNKKMVSSVLDFDKDVHQEREDFYDRVLGMVGTLGKIGAFDEKTWLCTCALGQGSDAVDAAGNCTHTDCPPDVCGTHNGIAESVYECEGGNPTTTIDGTTMTGICEYASCDWTAGCQQFCVAIGAGVYGGGMISCGQDCTSAMAGGAGSWNGGDFMAALEEDLINSAGCECGGEFKDAGPEGGGGQIFVCSECDDYPTPSCWRTYDTLGACVCDCDSPNNYEYGQNCEGNC